MLATGCASIEWMYMIFVTTPRVLHIWIQAPTLAQTKIIHRGLNVIHVAHACTNHVTINHDVDLCLKVIDFVRPFAVFQCKIEKLEERK